MVGILILLVFAEVGCVQGVRPHRRKRKSLTKLGYALWFMV